MSKQYSNKSTFNVKRIYHMLLINQRLPTGLHTGFWTKLRLHTHRPYHSN